jgi:nucleoside-diphosphate-sugar epimerase
MSQRIFIAGAAGLVGQNLIAQLARSGEFTLVGADKHARNTQVLRELHPTLEVIEADLAEPGPWQDVVADCDALIMLQAQIGGLDPTPFERNNVASTRLLLEAAARGRKPFVVHVSSSVVNSMACDLYTESKKAQEALVSRSGIRHVILRPTLMFGWFDRKHLGWLRRFMRRAPVFPIPGSGRYLRQPLYAGDFANIIRACLQRQVTGAYNISGLERIDYIDLIRLVREIDGSRTPIVRIPVWLFAWLLRTYALFDRDPPFTNAQLKALTTPDVFEVIDWPAIFGVKPTSLRDALTTTFKDPAYGEIELTF